VTESDCVNARNGTRGGIIDFVAAHRDVNFLHAVAHLNSNPRLLALEQCFGEAKRTYTSFYIPKQQRVAWPESGSRMTAFLQAFKCSKDVGQRLLIKNQAQVSTEGRIRLFPSESGSFALEFVQSENGRWKRNSEGKATRPFYETVGNKHGNKSHRDQLYPDEMREIADLYFSKLTGPPNPSNLGYKHGNDFDALIRGWTKYWNEVLAPETPLDPNLIKALIATESSFHPTEDNKLKGDKRALGLMQITNSTRKTLADEKGELKDRLVNVKEKEAFDPNLNIAAGIRWLFQKKKLASHRLKKEATWEEAVAEYKDFLRDLRSLEKFEKGKKMTKRQAEAKRQMEKFHRLYQELAK
jgi:hypothetical protein